jgi:hypothetical protein
MAICDLTAYCFFFCSTPTTKVERKVFLRSVFFEKVFERCVNGMTFGSEIRIEIERKTCFQSPSSPLSHLSLASSLSSSCSSWRRGFLFLLKMTFRNEIKLQAFSSFFSLSSLFSQSFKKNKKEDTPLRAVKQVNIRHIKFSLM